MTSSSPPHGGSTRCPPPAVHMFAPTTVQGSAVPSRFADTRRFATLHVVGVYSNPRRWASRERLFLEWMQRTMETPGVHLTVVEHAFGERPFLISDAVHDFDLVQFRGGPEHELWLKEGLVNAGFASILRRHPDAKYLCWEDADVTHVHPSWADETVHMLQHHRVGQTWTHAVDLDPGYSCATNEHGKDVDRSFCAAWLAGDIQLPKDQAQSRALLTHSKITDWRQHYGYSWAIRADALKGIGRLIDWMVTGSADYHMSMGFCGKMLSITDKELADNRSGLSAGYVRRLREFGAKCHDHIRQDLGCVPGIIMHHWHGNKKQRAYIGRKDIIIESGFDPDIDLVYDVHGLPTLATDNRLLRDGLRRYSYSRNEDSIDVI